MDRGWNDIGYHFVIQPDGLIERGRSLKVQGAHVEGHNEDNIGICLVGTDKYSDQQLEQCVQLLARLMSNFGITLNNVFGHNDFTDQKTCPGFDVEDLVGSMATGNPEYAKHFLGEENE